MGASSAQLAHEQTVARIDLAEAQREQARQEAESTRAADKTWRILLPVLTGLVGTFVVVVVPLLSQRKRDREERARAAQADINQRELESAREVEQRRSERAEAKRAAIADVKQREDAAVRQATQARKELIQRFDASFAAALAAMADPIAAAQAAGAAAMQSFLRADLREDFHDQTYLAVRAQLDIRIEHPDAVRAILVATLATLLRERCGRTGKPPAPRTASPVPRGGVDLASKWLQRADLREINLHSADLWRSDLRGARLDGACLRRARAWKCKLAHASFRDADLEEARFRAARAPGVVFSGARLVSARFEESILDGARFRGAKLQSAHFTDASLHAADFRDAEVRDAQFVGAAFTDETLSSLVLARDIWDPHQRTKRGGLTARLDQEAGDRLIALAKRQGLDWSPQGAPA